jgi:hypothetical protein
MSSTPTAVSCASEMQESAQLTDRTFRSEDGELQACINYAGPTTRYDTHQTDLPLFYHGAKPETGIEWGHQTDRTVNIKGKRYTVEVR